MSDSVIRKGTKMSLVLSVLMMSFCTYANACIIAPAMSEIAKNFPDVSIANIQLIMTFGMFGYFPMTLITGAIANKVPSKPFAILGGFLVSFGAIYPVFLHNHIALLYVSNFLMGVGQGIIVTLNSILIAHFFENKDHSKMYGWRGAVQNAASMLFSFAAGWLASLAWYNVYWTGVLTLPTLFACLALPNVKSLGELKKDETSLQEALPTAESVTLEGKKGVPLKAIAVAFFIFMFAVPYAVKMMNYAMLMDLKLGLGSTYAGTLLGITGIITVIGGVVYANFANVLKQHILWFGALLLGIGMYIQFIADGFTWFLIGACMTNLAFALAFTGGVDAIPKMVTPLQISASMGVFMAAQSLGSMVTPYLVNPIAIATMGESTAENNYQVSVVWCAATIIYAFAWCFFNKKYYTTLKEA
jgi:MFS family permease